MERRSCRASGFTLIEVLVASAILIILISIALSILVQSHRAYAATEASSERQQTHELVAQTLKYDLSLAGFKGTNPGDLSRTFASSPLEVVHDESSDSDSIQIRYYEDHTFDDAVASQVVEVGYYVLDGDLYREENGVEDVVFPGVLRLEITDYIDREAGSMGTTTMPATFSAVILEIEFESGFLDTFTVPVDNFS